MQHRVNHESLLEEMKFLREAKIPFKFLVNNHTYRVESKYGKYFSTDNKIPLKELNFVKQVKDYVLKNEIHLKLKDNYPKNKDGTRNHTSIKYFDYRMPTKNHKFIDELYEIDINQAYWDTALKETILNEELYKKGLKVKKKTRLAALGSLAKSTKVFGYDGKKMEWEDTTHKPTEHLWFKICERLGNTMFKAAKNCGNKFIFYWVDGIYVQGMDAAVAACESFQKDGYAYKVRKINSITFDMKNVELWVDDNIDGKRKFPLTEPKFKLIKSYKKKKK